MEPVGKVVYRKRGCGAMHCYGCLCDTCANSVELLSWYVTLGEMTAPCFSCDECRHYDGDLGKKDQWHEACLRHIEAKKAAEARAHELKRRAEAEDKRAQAIRARVQGDTEGGGGGRGNYMTTYPHWSRGANRK